jgi:hypothetical protein
VWTLKEEKAGGIVSVHETEQLALNNITGIFAGKYYVMDDLLLISVFFECINK